MQTFSKKQIMINQKLEELKEKLGVTKYTYVGTLEDFECYGPICYFVDDRSISSVNIKGKQKRYNFSFKRRYDVPLDEDAPSEYGVMCFYHYPEEQDEVYYYYYPGSKKHIIEEPQCGLAGRINMLDEINNKTILIGHVLKKIKNSNFL